MNEKKLSNLEIDAIGEILNISLGASATAVSSMLDTRVDITTPIVRVVNKEDFTFSNLKPAIAVEISYIEGLSGKSIMLLKRSDVKVIVEMLMGVTYTDQEFELNEMNVSAISEVMNQMMGASATALSELFSRSVNISTPLSYEVDGEETIKEKYFVEEDPMVVVSFSLSISDKMESEFMSLMTTDLAKELVKGFFANGLPDAKKQAAAASAEKPMRAEEKMPSQPDAGATANPSPAAPGVPAASETNVQSGVQPSGGMMEEMLKTMQLMQQQMMQMQNARDEKKISVKSAPVPALKGEDHVEDPEGSLDLLMGVPLELSVEIGRTQKLVKDILELNKGSLVVLDRVAGEPVDLYVNGECIAKGDVVVVDDNFGIRITEILQDDVAED